jgi:transposase
VLWDVLEDAYQALGFDTVDDDVFRKVGMSKERRVDPQIVVGLLVTPGGFPLEVHAFTGNTAETTTLIPVLASFQDRHGVKDIVVVADAGMLSAGNLTALEDAGFSFIVGSRISKAPHDLAEYFTSGVVLGDGETLESKRVMDVGANARERRVVYHYSAKRDRRDNHTLAKQVERAQKIVDGTRPVKKDRFVKLTGTRRGIDQGLVDRARQVAGLKGYVTNSPTSRLDGHSVVAAYHELFQVERSFRMAKPDLRARPMFHHQNDSIQAHLTIVFTALAIARHLQDITGISIRKLVRTLRPLRDVTIRIAGTEIIATTPPGPDATTILDTITHGTDAGLGDSLSHAAMAAGVAIMVSNSIGVKRPSAA